MVRMWTRMLQASVAMAAAALAQEVPRGEIMDNVKCAANASQTYAIYLPKNYSADRQWNLILAFDPRGRGRAPVEQFKDAAEKFGYIVAGSNNARNGPPDISLDAAAAMGSDVVQRFKINMKRVYTAGLSGGARIAMKVAMDSNEMAGVIASSAGFPPGERSSNLSFAVFGTAGTEDFNYLEMRQLDQTLNSPHRVVVFDGGHTWLPPELAVQALEWLDLQAMKAGRQARDEKLIDRVFAARAAEAASQKSEVATWEAASAMARDFDGLRDVSKFAAQVETLQAKKSVLDALNQQHADEHFEAQLESELRDLQEGLEDGGSARAASLSQLKDRLTKLAAQAAGPADTSERRMARRLMGGIYVDSRAVPDEEYQKFVDSLRPQERK
jgi:pimeloyl-ACP methyl ester carboxylesterase